MATNIPSSSRNEDEDIEMLDADYMHEDMHDAPGGPGDDADDHDVIAGGLGEGEHDEHDDEDDDDAEEARAERGLGAEEAASLSMFGDYRHLGSYMLGLSSRLKTMLNNIKRTADPTTRLLTLQELSELLSISTEDTLAGSFQVESFVRELVRILGGTGNDPEGEDDEDVEQDEDAALAAALALSTGGAYQGDENLEAQVLACRCLANLMEALPGVAHTVVYHGAIPVLCSKLIEISYIDLAEQTLSVSLVVFLSFCRERFYMSLSDFGEDFRRVPEFDSPGRRPRRAPQLPGLLLDSCAANRPSGRLELLSERVARTFPYDPRRLAHHTELSGLH